MYVLVARDPVGRVVGSIKVTEQPQVIGRGSECHLVLPSTGVSRNHATVYLHGDGVVVHDEGSANGVKVDGQLISGPTLVDDTNALQISSFLLSVEPDAPQRDPLPAGPDTDEDVAIDSDTRLEAFTGAGAAIANSALEIVGRGGAYDRTRFTLDTPLMTVGRADGNEIVLEDPSVSRRHAQLRISATGDRLTLLDLRSHNGTYLQGNRIKRADVTVGEVIRFGDLAFKLEKRRLGQRAGRRKRSPRRKLVLALGLLATIVLVVAAVAYKKRPPPQKPRASAIDLLQQRQARIQAMVDVARRKVNLRQWTDALRDLEQALEKDPLHAEGKRLHKTATEELGHEKTYREGMKFFVLGNRENILKAKAVFDKIPTESVYQREVRYKIKTINERIAGGHRIEGVSRCKARYWRQCQKSLCKFFSLLVVDGPPVSGEPALRRMLKQAEKKLRRRSDFVGCKTPRFLNPTKQNATGRDPRELLAERYPAPLQTVLQLYIGGKIEGALHKLGKLRSNRSMRPHATKMSEVNRQLLVINGKYQEGYAAFRQKKHSDADRYWSLLLTTDRTMLPEGIDSFYRQECRRMLGDLYFELGEEQLKAKRYRVAFTRFNRGVEINAQHDRLLNGLLQLDNVAARLIVEGKRLVSSGMVHDARSKLELARDISKPGTRVYKEAVEALTTLN